MIYQYNNTIFVSFFKEGEEVRYSLLVFNMDEDGVLTEICRIEHFNENEVILSMCVVNFEKKISDPQEYLAVGTGLMCTEDIQCPGRLFLFGMHGNNLFQQHL